MNLLQALINILVCEGLRLMGRLDYPLSILPENHYIPRINIDNLCKNVPLIVVRRSDKPKEDIFNKFGMMREDSDAILKHEIPGMSMNLLGGAFKYEHIKFNPIGEAAKIWDGYEKVFYFRYRKSINLLPIATPIFFEVANLQGIEFPYQRNRDKESTKLMDILGIQPREINGKFELLGKSYISHEPTRLNYWHVEFQIRDVENNLIEKTKSAWQKEAANSALSHIKSNASSVVSNISDIPKSYFCK